MKILEAKNITKMFPGVIALDSVDVAFEPGEIHEIIGENGFGYDPIFFLPEYGCTSSELSPEKKNELSHRGEGLRKMRAILSKKAENVNNK